MHYQRWRAHGSPLTKLTLKGEPLEYRFKQQTDFSPNPTGCHIWKGVTTYLGYGQIKVDDRTRSAHHVAWFIAHGRWPEQDILHSCDNPACVNVEHLSEGTHSENMRQMGERGRRNDKHGEFHHNAKLSYDQVCQIRDLRARGWKLKDIAKRYDIHFSTVWNITKGNTWNGDEDELKAA